MQNSLNLSDIALDLLTIERDFYHHLPRDYSKLARAQKLSSFNFYTFEQEWGDASGGFQSGGVEGVTTARTYVFISGDTSESFCVVFFGSRFAYVVPYSLTFMSDVQNKTVCGKSQWLTYLNPVVE